MKVVLVTGASGFIGRNSMEVLKEHGFVIYAAGRNDPGIAGVVFHKFDLIASTGVVELVADVKASHLLHLAWDAGDGHYLGLRQLDWITPSVNLLRHFAERGGERAVFAGTFAEYALGQNPIDEVTTPCEPTTFYGIAKDATRRAVETYAGLSGLSVAWARLFAAYGPGDRPGRLVHDAIGSLLAGRPFPATEGTQLRDFNHVRDAASALAMLLDGDVRGPVNIASGRIVTVRSLLEKVGAITGRSELLKFGARPMRAHETSLVQPRIDRMLNEVGYHPRITLDDGLADTIAWHRRQTERAGTFGEGAR